jgi:thiamine biosynthesis lipoprotein
MGTSYRVTYAAAAPAPNLPSEVEGVLAAINHSLSVWDSKSVLSTLNASTDAAAFHPVDADFAAVFTRSMEVYRDTSAAFNPAVGPLVREWGFGPDGSGPGQPGGNRIRELLELTRFEAFEFRPAPPAVRKPAAQAQLDFNAITEGYAVDRIAGILEARGIRHYLIELGGEVRAAGMRSADEPWRVGIERPVENPLAQGNLETVLELKDAALATSGSYRNFRIVDGKKVSHILDPQTGYPAGNSLLSVSVVARDAITADAYATALMVMGMERGMAFVETADSIEALFVAADEQGDLFVRQSPGFPKATP